MDPHAWWRSLAVLAVCVAFASSGFAQKKPEPETKSGKLSSVQPKGKTAAVKVETDDGETLEFQVTAKVPLAVKASGEKEILRVGAWVSCENIVLNETNKLFFAKDFLVHIGPPPQARVQRNMKNGYDVAGQIAMIAEDSITLRPNTKIMFDEGECNVSVQSNDIGLLEDGAPVEVEGIKRGEKFLPQRMSVTLDKTLTADDVYPTRGKPKKPVAKPGKTTAAAEKNEPTKATDPFGKKPPEEKGSPPAKATDPFGKTPPPAGKSDPVPTTADPFKDKPKEK